MGEQARDWPLDRTNDHTARYAHTAVAVAADLGLPCLDLYALLQQEERWGDRLFVDGLHFTPAGQERVWQLLQELLAASWPEARPEALASHFPPWEAIDVDNMTATFPIQ
ncbi:GDSL esterase/lipase At5g62930-like protein [Tetrabaena socialis]|uniref:GDSL esterase/lipase At5g62930-like protein n=1 Tax=Tetrabaena socialis TaxID=47790 RepID=A0A2J8AIM3_9CHLO|nr:GDSL esterase/lipase At5g62930-like protein [Tetrabaena socialis]|eukprot:PNH12363.1 GDSL esterase/lipase At5g62930-like protein [Tetrabaena socialis]